MCWSSNICIIIISSTFFLTEIRGDLFECTFCRLCQQKTSNSALSSAHFGHCTLSAALVLHLCQLEQSLSYELFKSCQLGLYFCMCRSVCKHVFEGFYLFPLAPSSAVITMIIWPPNQSTKATPHVPIHWPLSITCLTQAAQTENPTVELDAI